jgi:excisionase family DNA binding protein
MRLLTIPETAAWLQRAPLTINRMVHDGRLKAQRYGHMFLIDPADVREFIAQGGFRPTGRPKKAVQA